MGRYAHNGVPNHSNPDIQRHTNPTSIFWYWNNNNRNNTHEGVTMLRLLYMYFILNVLIGVGFITLKLFKFVIIMTEQYTDHTFVIGLIAAPLVIFTILTSAYALIFLEWLGIKLKLI